MPNKDLSNKWLNFAKMDYNVAVHDTSFHPIPVEIICYHCQQSAEKALKAVLAYNDAVIPHSHDLYRLLEQCAVFSPALMSFSTKANHLTDYAAVTRYPSHIELNETDMKLALDYADKILQAVDDLLNVQTPDGQ
jgi:HEPN domain-containing protein